MTLWKVFLIRNKQIINSQGGFSLLEILIAVTLLGIVSAVVTINVLERLEEGKVETAKVQMASFSTALKDFRRKCNRYPTTMEGLDALMNKPSEGRECPNYPPNGFLGEEAIEIPDDPWGEPYYYESEGRRYQIYSYGPDGEEGGEGLDADIYYPPRKNDAS